MLGVTPEMGLHAAASSGDVESLRTLLSNHGDETDSRNDSWETPLFCSCAAGQLGAAKLLLEAGANVNMRARKHFRPLHVAVKNGHIDVVRELVSAGAGLERETIRNMTPLLVALRYGQKSCAEFLLQHDVEVMAKDMFQRTALHWAIKVDQREIFERLVSKGADVSVKDKFKKTPVMQAVKSDRPELLVRLLSLGADRTSEDKLLRKPIHLAASKGHVRCLDVLLQSGTVQVDSVNNVYQQMTPLMLAASHGQIEAVKYLLDRGADPNRVNSHSQTALCLILMRRRKLDADVRHWCEIVRILVRANTDVNIEAIGPLSWNGDEHARSNALEIAFHKGFWDVVKILAVAGSRIPNLRKHLDANSNSLQSLIQNNPSDYEWLKHFYESPRPLKQLSRTAVLRNIPSPHFARSLKAFNLPPGVNAYLSFTDLDLFGPESVMEASADSAEDSNTEEEMEPSVFDSDLYGDHKVRDTDEDDPVARDFDDVDEGEYDLDVAELRDFEDEELDLQNT